MQESHLCLQIELVTQHLSDALAMMPDLEVLFHFLTIGLEPMHLVSEGQVELLDKFTTVEPRRVVSFAKLDHFLGQTVCTFAHLFHFQHCSEVAHNFLIGRPVVDSADWGEPFLELGHRLQIIPIVSHSRQERHEFSRTLDHFRLFYYKSYNY